MDEAAKSLIVVGRIIGTHGIRGQVKLHSYSGILDTLRKADRINVRLSDGALKELGLKKAAPHGGKFLLTLSGFDNINQVQWLVGSEVCLYREQLPEPDEDEYYWHDLMGLSVVTDAGELLGKIAEILETGANDVYLVQGNNKEYLIPAVGSVINKVDLTSGLMTITPPEGLLDL